MKPAFRTLLMRSWPVSSSILLHALLLFGVLPVGFQAAQYGMHTGEGSDSVTTLQARVQLEAIPEEPEPEPEPVPLPKPEPEPKLEPEPEPEAIPFPEEVAEEPEPKPEPKPKPRPKPETNTPASTSGSPNPAPTASRARALKSVDYLRNPPPAYPASARRRGIEGTVRLAVDISASGRVENVRIRLSSGNADLDRAALEAVQRWRFRPARAAGRKIASRAVIPIVFQLDR